MSDTEKPQTESTPPQAGPPNPNPPASPAAETAASKPPAAPQPGKRGFRPQSRVRRISERVPSLEDDLRFTSRPNLKDLDAEIAGELEAALGGLSEKELIAEDRPQPAAPGESTRKKGKVLSVHGADVFVDVPGGRSQGVLPVAQFPDGPPKPGTEVEFDIEGYDNANGLLLLTRRGAAVHADWSSVSEGMVVEARVTETNKGGLAVDVNGIRGFMPVSQIDLYRVENADEYVNQRLRCIVTEVNPEERNLVVSRRALLEKEREEAREKLWAELAEGQVREGIVRKVLDFGAFIDLGGADGLLPISEMSWQRVNDPTTLVQPGQRLKVAVTRLDREARKVTLSLKQLVPSPWDNVEEKYPTGRIVPGKVTRLATFGAFVELEPGVEGLVHISELAPQRVIRVGDIVKPEQPVQVLVRSVDPEARRISLSLKDAAAEEAAEETTGDQAEAEAPPPRTTPLRGGIGQDWTTPGEQGLQG